MKKIQLLQIRETGGSRTGTLNATYQEIVDTVGKPNVTDMDDDKKVKASWGFSDASCFSKGRKGFIWCYKFYGDAKDCTSWSVDGDKDLLNELFPGKVS